MAAPRVSICVPTYNQVVYLERTLTSILEQEFRDFELIISDDSSTDDVANLVARYHDRLPQGSLYVRNKPAKGTPANWNSAIARATGQFIKIMHHDEWFTGPDSLGRFVDATENADFVFSSVVTHVEKDGRQWELHPSASEVQGIISDPETIMLANIIGPPSATMYRRDLAQAYDVRFTYVVDMEFYLRVFRTGARVARIADPLIQAVSDAAHNVTNYSRTPDIELREYLVLFDELRPRIRRALLPRFSRFLFWLFVRYGIDATAKLKTFHPAWKGGGLYRNIIWRVKGYHLRNRLFRRNN